VQLIHAPPATQRHRFVESRASESGAAPAFLDLGVELRLLGQIHVVLRLRRFGIILSPYL